jgi:hypothetical protein
VWVALAAPPTAGENLPEPGLAEAQAAAARLAGGASAEDVSRTSRARNSHWAPVLRGQGVRRDDERSRRGEFRLAPLIEDDRAAGHTWAVTVTWDFSQVVYAREESQLALAHAHLARLRREAAERAGKSWVDRARARVSLAGLPPGPRRLEAQLELLRLTAELDALTGGLFRDALSREEAACAMEERK